MQVRYQTAGSEQRMKIWVDADACPGVIKDVLFRAAGRWEIPVTLVANMSLSTPPSPFIDSVVVGAGSDVADRKIAESTRPGDIVVTADIPLAALVVDAGGIAIDPRGELYTEQNIGARLQARNLMEQLRSSGMETGGPPPFSDRNKQEFANQLDRLLVKRKRQQSR